MVARPLRSRAFSFNLRFEEPLLGNAAVRVGVDR
jgi:hypothetical protein